MKRAKATLMLAAIGLSFGLAGCGTTTASRTTTGALGGAAAGAAIGSFSGDAGKGALIGGAAGALGGALYDANEKEKERAYRARVLPFLLVPRLTQVCGTVVPARIAGTQTPWTAPLGSPPCVYRVGEALASPPSEPATC